MEGGLAGTSWESLTGILVYEEQAVAIMTERSGQAEEPFKRQNRQNITVRGCPASGLTIRVEWSLMKRGTG